MDEKTPAYYETLIKDEWSYSKGAVIMAVLATSLMAFAGGWGVSGILSAWGGKFFGLFGVGLDGWLKKDLSTFNPLGQETMTNAGIAFGALISCLLAGQWKIRHVKSIRQVWAAILGGLLMGIGSRIGPGCNIGGMFSAIPAFSLSGWVFFVFVFLGSISGGKLLPYFIPPVSHERRLKTKKSAPGQLKQKRNVQIALGILLIMVCLAFAGAAGRTAPSAGLMLFTGLGLGYTLRRSRFCFTSAFRDPTLTGETKLTKALLVALGVSTIGFAGVHISRYGVDLSKLPENMGALARPIGLHLVIGAFLFGLGAVLAGGCASGTLMRFGEGYVQNALAFTAFVLGAIIGDGLYAGPVKENPFLYSGKGVYLPAVLGGYGPVILIQLSALGLLWIIADWREKKKSAGFGKG
ncbi:MAG: YeeE/YedE family protein [Treponema sp.]|jgi:uncharacterized membrane protein YedE/YeeE|nr:YeeE/YedE family protein [Treponema sp.]